MNFSKNNHQELNQSNGQVDVSAINHQFNSEAALIIQKPIIRLNKEEALKLLGSIPDHFSFRHDFHYQSPFLGFICGGKYEECSKFEFPSLGQLIFKFTKEASGLKCCQRKQRKGCCQGCTLNPYTICCPWVNNLHFFELPSYTIENEKLSIEFKDNLGKLFIQGNLILEFIECDRNSHDIFAASAQSTMPQMVVYDPTKHSNSMIRVKSEMSVCPEHPYSFEGACQSFGGIKRLSRKFEITGLSNSKAKCSITNTRSGSQACYSQCGCRDVCLMDKCRFADFPDFVVGFADCNQFEKLSIIACLIHFNMYNAWKHYNYSGRISGRQNGSQLH